MGWLLLCFVLLLLDGFSSAPLSAASKLIKTPDAGEKTIQSTPPPNRSPTTWSWTSTSHWCFLETEDPEATIPPQCHDMPMETAPLTCYGRRKVYSFFHFFPTPLPIFIFYYPRWSSKPTFQRCLEAPEAHILATFGGTKAPEIFLKRYDLAVQPLASYTFLFSTSFFNFYFYPIHHAITFAHRWYKQCNAMSCHFPRIWMFQTFLEAQFEHFSLTSFFTSFSLTISIESKAYNNSFQKLCTFQHLHFTFMSFTNLYQV